MLGRIGAWRILEGGLKACVLRWFLTFLTKTRFQELQKHRKNTLLCDLGAAKTLYFTMVFEENDAKTWNRANISFWVDFHRKIRCFLKHACENHRILRWFWGNLTPKWTQDGVKMVLRWRYVGSCWRSWALSWLILALLGSILSPSCRKMAPRFPNIAPKRARECANTAQGRAERGLSPLYPSPKDPPKGHA